ncbi:MULTISPECIES: hypothetical protein [unclassified Mycoplasma]|uniref:hypothetical protein n=1 Tax=unclassified Mycoplasma TaxID=2683645 RepID=UPI00216B04E3|nr:MULTISPECIES: hypothetical protein [unclassified Mycoplasma]MCS4536705.1 hypothetical protein [Mycoplasma sp. CSL7475-4]MCT4469808.1 hypothetical protein [Mycoplasma sp. HS2188]
MSSLKLFKFFISEDKSKDSEKFNLEIAQTGEKTGFSNLDDLTSTVEELSLGNEQESRIWVVKNKKFVGSLSLNEFKDVLAKVKKENVEAGNALSYIIENKLLHDDHELVFLDPRWKNVSLLFIVAIVLFIIVLALTTKIYLDLPTN